MRASVFVRWIVPLDRSSISIVALGRTAWVGSVTIPESAPLVDVWQWGAMGTKIASANEAAKTNPCQRIESIPRAACTNLGHDTPSSSELRPKRPSKTPLRRVFQSLEQFSKSDRIRTIRASGRRKS